MEKVEKMEKILAILEKIIVTIPSPQCACPISSSIFPRLHARVRVWQQYEIVGYACGWEKVEGYRVGRSCHATCLLKLAACDCFQSSSSSSISQSPYWNACCMSVFITIICCSSLQKPCFSCLEDWSILISCFEIHSSYLLTPSYIKTHFTFA